MPEFHESFTNFLTLTLFSSSLFLLERTHVSAGRNNPGEMDGSNVLLSLSSSGSAEQR